MDRDFDQKLTFAEFMGEESHIEKLFKSMDKNNDGFVTKKVVQAKFNFFGKKCISCSWEGQVHFHKGHYQL